MTRAIGIEITKYQLAFNPKTVTRKIDFVTQRVSYGMNEDELLNQLFEGVRQFPRRGAYHYFSSNIPWREQADRFLQICSGRGYLFYALDWERKYNNVNEGFATSATEWMKYVTAATGQPVQLYTNQELYNLYFGWDARCENFPLHLAQYYFLRPDPQTKNPIVPKTRKKGWRIWQFFAGEHVSLPEAKEWGCANGPELDVFNGTIEEFDALFSPIIPPQPPRPTLEQRVDAIENRLDRAGISK